jgi:hypothetical protein
MADNHLGSIWFSRSFTKDVAQAVKNLGYILNIRHSGRDCRNPDATVGISQHRTVKSDRAVRFFLRFPSYCVIFNVHIPVTRFRHPCRNDDSNALGSYATQQGSNSCDKSRYLGPSLYTSAFKPVIPAWMPESRARDGNFQVLCFELGFKRSHPCGWIPASLPE